MHANTFGSASIHHHARLETSSTDYSWRQYSYSIVLHPCWPQLRAKLYTALHITPYTISPSAKAAVIALRPPQYDHSLLVTFQTRSPSLGELLTICCTPNGVVRVALPWLWEKAGLGYLAAECDWILGSDRRGFDDPIDW